MDFYDKLLPANKNQVFMVEDWFTWGASVCKYEDRYYIFVSAWEKKYTFAGWVKHSTILKGISHKPEGPFKLLGELKELKEQTWAKEVLHNPTIKQIGNKYYLYYVGTHFEINDNTRSLPNDTEIYRYNQKIGVAVAENPEELFIPYEQNPILDRADGQWDGTFVTNPSILVDEDKVFLAYKALIKEKLPDIILILGMSEADNPLGPFKRCQSIPITTDNIEDPFVWKEKDRYFMLAKDMTGEIAGAANFALLYTSQNMVDWQQCEDKVAYGLDIKWEDGVERFLNVERPQIYFENEKPICLYNAIMRNKGETFNLARRFRNG